MTVLGTHGSFFVPKTEFCARQILADDGMNKRFTEAMHSCEEVVAKKY